MSDLSFFKGKKVFITGHTGFKGSWMCQALLGAGAQVTGYALKPAAEPALFDILKLKEQMNSIEGDVRDGEKLSGAVKESLPEIVIHMAAQPIVRESYERPVYTYETNVMGTVNILEAVRKTDTVRSFINVTTDKVYLNKEWVWGYRENEELNGYDPYSNSKSCAELVTGCYQRSFFEKRDIAISTFRAGNVIGGGDFARDRIIPDCVRAAKKGQDIIIRNPDSIRPYQHVLEPVMAYLMAAEAQYQDISLAGAYNIGPDEEDSITSGKIAGLFCSKWQELSGKEQSWVAQGDHGPHEAGLLKLDCAKVKEIFGWRPVWKIEQTVKETAEWYYRFLQKEDMIDFTAKQTQKYMAGKNNGTRSREAL